MPLVDMYAAYEALAKEPGHTPDKLLLDDMHPNAKGQQQVADRLIPLVLDALKKQSLP